MLSKSNRVKVYHVPLHSQIINILKPQGNHPFMPAQFQSVDQMPALWQPGCLTIHNASSVCFWQAAERETSPLRLSTLFTGRGETSLSHSRRAHANVRIKQILEQPTTTDVISETCRVVSATHACTCRILWSRSGSWSWVDIPWFGNNGLFLWHEECCVYSVKDFFLRRWYTKYDHPLSWGPTSCRDRCGGRRAYLRWYWAVCRQFRCPSALLPPLCSAPAPESARPLDTPAQERGPVPGCRWRGTALVRPRAPCESWVQPAPGRPPIPSPARWRLPWGACRSRTGRGPARPVWCRRGPRVLQSLWFSPAARGSPPSSRSGSRTLRLPINHQLNVT